MDHGDPLPGDRCGDPFGIRDAVGRRDPERRADKIGDPDLFERHIKGHGEALIDHVIFTNAEDFVLAPQEMANAAMIDDDPLGLPCRARGVDCIGRIGRPSEIARVARRISAPPAPSRSSMAQSGAGLPASLAVHSRVRNQSAGAGRAKAKLDALARRRGIQRQPGGAALGNPRLGDQQIGPPRQVQADHRAALRPAGDQFACHGIAERVEFRIGHDPIAPDQGRMIGARRAVARRMSPRHSSRSKSGVTDLAATCRIRPMVKYEKTQSRDKSRIAVHLDHRFGEPRRRYRRVVARLPRQGVNLPLYSSAGLEWCHCVATYE